MDVVPAPVRRAWARLGPWRAPLKYAAWSFGGLVLAIIAFLGVLYATTDIPNPHGDAIAQAAVISYADGSQLAVVGDVNRIDVPLHAVPPGVQRAVLAAEDRHFYSEPGVSLTDTLRAAWVDITGGHLQGGSTITQQYVRNAYLSQKQTIWRKIKEIVIAVKVWQQRSKSEVLRDYLNTVYFGRGAYGIQAASRAYFGTSVSHLDVAQGAVLAASIRGPSIYDPVTHPELAKHRWHYVVNGMMKAGFLPQSKAAALTYPKVLPPHRQGPFAGPRGYVIQAVLHELKQRGFSDQQIDRSGLRVTTTIDPHMQKAAIGAEYGVLKDAPKDPLSALVAVVPGDGAIRAMYGGRDYTANTPAAKVNKATQITRQAGSSFKPYVLATALKQGIGLYQTFDGSSPKKVPGYPGLLHNFADEQCTPCSLLKATALSINTVYVPLAIRVGPDHVADTAHAAGIPASVPLTGPNGETTAGIALGIYGVHPIDQAVGFATFAAGGVRAAPYLVATVRDRHGDVLYQHKAKPKRALPKDVSADVTYALQQVIKNGTASSEAPLAGGRPAAGKTGTTENEADAWFVGYTPQLSAAVWMGYDSRAHKLHDVEGVPVVTGGTLPARIWRRFMDVALKGKPVKDFPGYQPVAPGSPPPTTHTPSPAPPTATAPTTSSPVPSRPASSSPPPPAPTPTQSPAPPPTPSPQPSSTPSQPAPPSPAPTKPPGSSPSPTPTAGDKQNGAASPGP